MTYGEYYVANRDKLISQWMKDEDSDGYVKAPKRMQKYKVGGYYNRKLFNYWVKQLQEQYPKLQLSKARQQVTYLMFNTDTLKYQDIDEE